MAPAPVKLSLPKRIAFHAVAFAIDVVKFGLGGAVACALLLTPCELTTGRSMAFASLLALTLLGFGVVLRRIDERGGNEAIGWAALLIPSCILHWICHELQWWQW